MKWRKTGNKASDDEEEPKYEHKSEHHEGITNYLCIWVFFLYALSQFCRRIIRLLIRQGCMVSELCSEMTTRYIWLNNHWSKNVTAKFDFRAEISYPAT